MLWALSCFMALGFLRTTPSSVVSFITTQGQGSLERIAISPPLFPTWNILFLLCLEIFLNTASSHLSLSSYKFLSPAFYPCIFRSDSLHSICFSGSFYWFWSSKLERKSTNTGITLLSFSSLPDTLRQALRPLESDHLRQRVISKESKGSDVYKRKQETILNVLPWEDM